MSPVYLYNMYIVSYLISYSKSNTQQQPHMLPVQAFGIGRLSF